jgi:hypothetical protein
MHHKNILKKAVVLTLSLICTHGVAMEQEEAVLPRQPRTCIVDFYIRHYGRMAQYPDVAVTIQNVEITTRPGMADYIVKKGIQEAAKQGFMFHYPYMKDIYVNHHPILPNHNDDMLIEALLFNDSTYNQENRIVSITFPPFDERS